MDATTDVRPPARQTARPRTALAAVAVLGAALGGTLAACAGSAPPPPAASAGTSPLAGVWDATFALDAPPLGFDTAALRARPDGRVHGMLVFVPNHWLTAADVAGAGLPTAPTLYGTYDLDFRPFGFDPRDPDRVPGVVATASTPGGPNGADSVMVVLGPSDDREQVTLAGVLRSDSVVGRWRVQGAGRSALTAGGQFVLVAASAAAPRAATPRPTLGARARGILLRGGSTAGAEP